MDSMGQVAQGYHANILMLICLCIEDTTGGEFIKDKQ